MGHRKYKSCTIDKHAFCKQTYSCILEKSIIQASCRKCLFRRAEMKYGEGNEETFAIEQEGNSGSWRHVEK